MQKILSKIDATTYIFMIKADVLEKKVFQDEQSNYKQSKFLGYYYDKTTLKNDREIKLTTIAKINKEIQKSVQNRLDAGKSFSIYYKNQDIYNNASIVVSFTAVPNLNNKIVAYIIHYTFGNYIDTIFEKEQLLLWILTLFTFILSLGVTFYIFLQKSKQNSLHDFAVHDTLTGRRISAHSTKLLTNLL